MPKENEIIKRDLKETNPDKINKFIDRFSGEVPDECYKWLRNHPDKGGKK